MIVNSCIENVKNCIKIWDKIRIVIKIWDEIRIEIWMLTNLALRLLASLPRLLSKNPNSQNFLLLFFTLTVSS